MNFSLSEIRFDQVAVGRRAVDTIDGRIEHPGVAAEEGAGLAGLEDHLCHGATPGLGTGVGN